QVIAVWPGGDQEVLAAMLPGVDGTRNQCGCFWKPSDGMLLVITPPCCSSVKASLALSVAARSSMPATGRSSCASAGAGCACSPRASASAQPSTNSVMARHRFTRIPPPCRVLCCQCTPAVQDDKPFPDVLLALQHVIYLLAERGIHAELDHGPVMTTKDTVDQ